VLDAELAQMLLEGNSLKTTEVYLHITNKHLKTIKMPMDHLGIKV